MKKPAASKKLQPDLPTFGEGFLDDHAGHIVSEAVYNKVVTVVPMLYRTLLDNAQARTFNLQRQLEKLGLAMKVDPEVEEVLQTPQQSAFAAV